MTVGIVVDTAASIGLGWFSAVHDFTAETMRWSMSVIKFLITTSAIVFNSLCRTLTCTSSFAADDGLSDRSCFRIFIYSTSVRWRRSIRQCDSRSPSCNAANSGGPLPSVLRFTAGSKFKVLCFLGSRNIRSGSEVILVNFRVLSRI